MKAVSITLFGVCLAAVAACAGDSTHKPSSSQDVPSLTDAVNIVRLVNTAEEASLRKSGSYVSLAELVRSGSLLQATSRSSNKTLATAYDQLQLKNDTAPLPGYKFAMLVRADGKAYQLSLKEDKACGAVIFTDEQATIFQGSQIGYAK